MKYLMHLVMLGSINAIAVCGVTLLIGFTGMFSLGHAGFMAIGAYAAAFLCKTTGLNYLLCILFGALFSMLIGMLFGYPTIKNRLTGDYFAIVMMGFGEAVRIFIANEYKYLNGAMGYQKIPKHTTLALVLILLVALVYCMASFIKSQHGRNCIAIREDEYAAEVLGINAIKTKMMALMISGFYCGIAGALYGFYMGALYPQVFSGTMSNDFTAAIVIGGMGSLSGPLFAGFFLPWLPEVARFFSEWRLVFYGLAFVLIMLFRPEGLYGYKEFSIKRTVKNIRLFPAKVKGLFSKRAKRDDSGGKE